MSDKPSSADRRKQALRSNLRRRKAQLRDMSGGSGEDDGTARLKPRLRSLRQQDSGKRDRYGSGSGPGPGIGPGIGHEHDETGGKDTD